VRIVLQNNDFHFDICDSSFVTEILLLGSSRPLFCSDDLYNTAEFFVQRECFVSIVLCLSVLVTVAHVSKALNKINRDGGLIAPGWVTH
jgi:hypothetical protein